MLDGFGSQRRVFRLHHGLSPLCRCCFSAPGHALRGQPRYVLVLAALPRWSRCIFLRIPAVGACGLAFTSTRSTFRSCLVMAAGLPTPASSVHCSMTVPRGVSPSRLLAAISGRGSGSQWGLPTLFPVPLPSIPAADRSTRMRDGPGLWHQETDQYPHHFGYQVHRAARWKGSPAICPWLARLDPG